MTIRDFLKEVLRNGDDMFIQTEVKLDEGSLIKKITDITDIPEKGYYIEAEWDTADVIPNAGEFEIKEKGYFLFYYIMHDDYFYIEKMKDEEEVIDFIKRMYGNMFIPDIVVLLDGKKIEYEAKKIEHEVVVTWK